MPGTGMALARRRYGVVAVHPCSWARETRDVLSGMPGIPRAALGNPLPLGHQHIAVDGGLYLAAS